MAFQIHLAASFGAVQGVLVRGNMAGLGAAPPLTYYDDMPRLQSVCCSGLRLFRRHTVKWWMNCNGHDSTVSPV